MPKDEMTFVSQILSEVDWKMITIKLLKPLIDGIFQFNNHYLKYPEEIREKIKTYLEKRYACEEKNRVNIDQVDFLIAHHLITDQVLTYSFLYLNTNTRSLFKVPAQKKKLYQYLIAQNKKFETNQKGRKKTLINKDLITLVENFLGTQKSNGMYLFLNRKDIKSDKEQTMKIIESYVKEDKNSFKFPMKFL